MRLYCRHLSLVCASQTWSEAARTTSFQTLIDRGYFIGCCRCIKHMFGPVVCRKLCVLQTDKCLVSVAECCWPLSKNVLGRYVRTCLNRSICVSGLAIVSFARMSVDELSAVETFVYLQQMSDNPVCRGWLFYRPSL